MSRDAHQPVSRRRSVESGVGKLTLIVFGTLFAAVCFVAYHVLPFYYYYYELTMHMQELIKVADVNTDQEIRKKLMYYIKWMEIPAEPEDLRIERRDHFLSISLPYREIFYVTLNGKDYDLRVFEFNAHAEGAF